MTGPDLGVIVVRREIPSSEPVAAGQAVEAYALLDPLDFVVDEPLKMRGFDWDAHAWMKAQADRIAAERKEVGCGRFGGTVVSVRGHQALRLSTSTRREPRGSPSVPKGCRPHFAAQPTSTHAGARCPCIRTRTALSTSR